MIKGPVSHRGNSIHSSAKPTCPGKLWEGSGEVGRKEIVQMFVGSYKARTGLAGHGGAIKSF